jgi:hypothetical protein
MSDSDRQLLSFGVFIIIIVIGILLVLAGLINWGLFVPVILVLCGFWTIALAGIRASKPQKYERGVYGTIGIGLALIALGGAWYLYQFGWLYSLVIILLAIAAVAITTALRPK